MKDKTKGRAGLPPEDEAGEISRENLYREIRKSLHKASLLIGECAVEAILALRQEMRIAPTAATRVRAAQAIISQLDRLRELDTEDRLAALEEALRRDLEAEGGPGLRRVG